MPIDSHYWACGCLSSPLSALNKVSPKTWTAEHFTIAQDALDELKALDPLLYFAEPVDEDAEPTYRSIIPDPMDFSTMRKKLMNGWYTPGRERQELGDDFLLICRNALVFNTKLDNPFRIAAKRLHTHGIHVLRTLFVDDFCQALKEEEEGEEDYDEAQDPDEVSLEAGLVVKAESVDASTAGEPAEQLTEEASAKEGEESYIPEPATGPYATRRGRIVSAGGGDRGRSTGSRKTPTTATPSKLVRVPKHAPRDPRYVLGKLPDSYCLSSMHATIVDTCETTSCPIK